MACEGLVPPEAAIFGLKVLLLLDAPPPFLLDSIKN
jgi:hypothetical protein